MIRVPDFFQPEMPMNETIKEELGEEDFTRTFSARESMKSARGEHLLSTGKDNNETHRFTF